MSGRERKRKLVGPWRNIHGAIWLIGIVILATQNWFWPGILVLIALSGILEAVLMQYVPHAFEDEAEPAPAVPAAAPIAPAIQPEPERPFDRLPSTCPKCGAPVRSHEVKWTSPRSADCSFCGANLPLSK